MIIFSYQDNSELGTDSSFATDTDADVSVGDATASSSKQLVSSPDRQQSPSVITRALGLFKKPRTNAAQKVSRI